MKKLLLTILSVILFIIPTFAITYDYDNYDYSKAPEYSNKEYMIPTSEIDSFKYESFKNGFLGLFGDEYSYVTIHLTAKGKEMLKKGTSKFKEMHILDNGAFEGGKCLDSKDITKPITDGIIHTSWLSDGKGAMSTAVNYNKALAYGGGVIIVFGELKYPPKEKVKETEPTTHREITLEKDSTKKVVEEEKVNETKGSTTNENKNSGINNSNVNSSNTNNVSNGNTIAPLIKSAKCITEYPSETSINNIDSIKFGAFPQSGTNNEPIEWIVLEKDNDKALLMSKYCIVNSPYGNNEDGEITTADGLIMTKYPWGKSDLRNYLNKEFYDTAFSKDEKSSILTNTYINAFKNDKVFIPSFNELDKYFKIFDVDWLQTSWDGVVEDTMTTKASKMEVERAMGAQLKTEIKKLESIPTNNVTTSSNGGGKSFIVYDPEVQQVTYVSKTYVGTSDGGMQNFKYEGTTRPLIWVSLNGAASTVESTNNEIQASSANNVNNSIYSQLNNAIKMADYSLEAHNFSFNYLDVVKFGNYYQNDANTKEPIEWYVIAKDDNSVQLISKYGLDCKSYNDVFVDGLTWENCALRKWLNNDFYNIAFTPEEQGQIIETLQIPDEEEYGLLERGKETNDKIFIPSIKEVDRFMGKLMQCDVTKYTIERGVITKDIAPYFNMDGYNPWWLRTMKKNKNGYCHANAYWTGAGTHEASVRQENFAVRPTLRVRIK